MSNNRWLDGYNAGVVAVAAHMRQKADLFRECGEDGKAKPYYDMALATLLKLKPVGIELATLHTIAGPVTVNRQGEDEGER